MGSYAYWLATGIAFVISVFCAVAEGALLSYSPSRLEEQLKDPARRARVQAYLGQVDRYLFSSIVLNAMSDVALVFACTLGFYRSGEGSLSSVSALVTAMLVVIVGAEVVPRAFSAYYAEALLQRVLPPLAVADWIFAPIIYPLRKLHDGIAHALGSDGKDRRAAEIKDDILSAAMEGSREGVLDPDASEMIENVIEFRDVEVRAIMTPRGEMGAIEAGTPIQEAVKIALEKGHSRMPVYEGTRDKVIGILLAKDLLVAWGKANGAAVKDASLSLRGLLRKPYFVPETKLIGELLREFRAKKVHVAIVLDEYGGTAGLVTIEDIIEEIVGEIEDEYDTSEEAPAALKRLDDRTAEVDARLHIHEVNEALAIAIPEDGGQYETLGGYLFYTMGRVPKKGERYAHDDAEFTVVDVDERRIKRVRVQVAKREPTS